VKEPEGKRPPGRQRRGWMDNIKLDMGQIRWDSVDWIGLAQDKDKWRALVNSVMNFRVALNTGRLSNGFTTGDLSNITLLHRVA
jgi:hypothetical protein